MYLLIPLKENSKKNKYQTLALKSVFKNVVVVAF
jgi:hypothetical protein